MPLLRGNELFVRSNQAGDLQQDKLHRDKQEPTNWEIRTTKERVGVIGLATLSSLGVTAISFLVMSIRKSGESLSPMSPGKIHIALVMSSISIAVIIGVHIIWARRRG